jgi:hypothetical protein
MQSLFEILEICSLLFERHGVTEDEVTITRCENLVNEARTLAQLHKSHAIHGVMRTAPQFENLA